MRAIVDVGVLDIEHKQIEPITEDIKIIGASSDMMILDLSDNPDNLKVGDTIDFSMNYLAVLRAMNSEYVDKLIDHEILSSELKILDHQN